MRIRRFLILGFHKIFRELKGAFIIRLVVIPLKVTDEELMLALLNSPTQKQAAALLGVTEQTISKRIKEADFQKRFSELRRKMLDSVSSELTKASYAAANKLVEFLDSKNEQLRYSACCKILQLANDTVALNEIIQRLDRLENGKS